MIATELKILTTVSHKQIPPEALDLSAPMVRAFALMVTEIRRRVVEHGRAAKGTFSRYSTRSNKRGPKNFKRSGTLWRSLRARQQSPTKVTAGFSGKAKDGWSRRRDKATGRNVLRRGKRGRFMRLGNIELGRILQAKEKASILEPSAVELENFEQLLAKALDEQSIRAIGFEELAFRASRKQRSLERRAKKAIRELGRTHFEFLGARLR